MLTQPVLLYDGQCEFCRGWADRLRHLDRAGAIRLVPSSDRQQVEGLPDIDDAELDRAMHLVTPAGEILAGARSIPEILRHIPRYRLLRWWFGVPGALPAAELVYSAIARRRHRFGCGSDRCRIGQI